MRYVFAHCMCNISIVDSWMACGRCKECGIRPRIFDQSERFDEAVSEREFHEIRDREIARFRSDRYGKIPRTARFPLR